MKSLANFVKLSAFTLAFSSSFIASNVAQFSDSFGEVDVNADYMTSYVFDETDISSDKVNLNGSKIEILQPGVYQINYSLSWRTTDDDRRQIQTAILVNGSEQASQSYAMREVMSLCEKVGERNLALIAQLFILNFRLVIL